VTSGEAHRYPGPFSRAERLWDTYAMTTSSHSEACRCRLHTKMIESRRHQCYRDLARAILGPSAPREDSALARALAEHARQLSEANASKVTPIRRHRAA
jgi:hypothetical protein